MKKITINCNVDITEWLEEQLESIKGDTLGIAGIFDYLLIKHEQFIKKNGFLIDKPDTKKGDVEYSNLSNLKDKELMPYYQDTLNDIVKALTFDCDEDY